MLTPRSEANRHQSPPLESLSTRSDRYGTVLRRAVCDSNAWNREESEIAQRLRDLPERLASLESFRERR